MLHNESIAVDSIKMNFIAVSRAAIHRMNSKKHETNSIYILFMLLYYCLATQQQHATYMTAATNKNILWVPSAQSQSGSMGGPMGFLNDEQTFLCTISDFLLLLSHFQEVVAKLTITDHGVRVNRTQCSHIGR